MSLVVKTLSEQAYELIRERILSTQMEPSRPIRQDALSGELGISKVPVREALTRLEQDGLIVSHANRGYVVLPLAIGEAEDVFGLRAIIEPSAGAEGARFSDDTARDQVSAAYAEMERVEMPPGPLAGTLNRNFHLAMVRPSGRNVTLAVLERLHLICERYARSHLEPPNRKGRVHAEHKAIFDAWMSRDEKAVRRLLEAHDRNTLDELRVQLSSPT